MSPRILLLAVGVAALSSCSSVYRSGQTPDDVYYSPAKEQAAYVETNNNREERYRGNEQSYEDYVDNYRNDRFLRMSVGKPYYRNYYDNYSFYDWRYNTYSSNWSSWNSPWNNYWYWNNFYNPYCRPGSVIIVNPKQYAYRTVSKPVAFNVSSYSPRGNTMGGYNNRYYNTGTNSNRYNNSNSGSLGNSLRKAFGNSNSNNNYSPSNSTSTPTRSYSPSSSSGSSSSGSSSGSSGSVSRPTRGGN